MDKQELLALYEARGDERDFLAAKPLYEEAIGAGPTGRLLVDYGYLLHCHGRVELRRAVEQYERAIELDPDDDQGHYQLILTKASLGDGDDAIDTYELRLAAAPGDIRGYRFLASAYLAAHRYEQAQRIVEAGLGVAADDAALIAFRGDVKAGSGDPEGALADWRRALELDGENLGPLYSSAFLFEREGRLAEAADAWEAIIEWSEERGNTLDAEWPRREVARLRELMT